MRSIRVGDESLNIEAKSGRVVVNGQSMTPAQAREVAAALNLAGREACRLATEDAAALAAAFGAVQA